MSAGRCAICRDGSGGYPATRDGLRLHANWRFREDPPWSVVLMVSGVTGIDPDAERVVLEPLSDAGIAVVLLQPGSTAWSEGRRGDIGDMQALIRGYADLAAETAGRFPEVPLVLFGHSMGGAFALATAVAIQGRTRPAGVVLVNPAFRYRRLKGATPPLQDYIRFAAYAVFAPWVPVVDMGGDPAQLQDPEDRAEASERRAILAALPRLLRWIADRSPVRARHPLPTAMEKR